MFYKVTRIRIK